MSVGPFPFPFYTEEQSDPSSGSIIPTVIGVIFALVAFVVVVAVVLYIRYIIENFANNCLE